MVNYVVASEAAATEIYLHSFPSGSLKSKKRKPRLNFNKIIKIHKMLRYLLVDAHYHKIKETQLKLKNI